MMDLKRLKHITVLAEERNVSRAAERVNLSQPAFSRSVQAAEAELGLRLFDRGGAQVTCTTAGEFVVERARRLLFDSRCLARDATLFREREMGDLSLGVGPFPAATLLPRLMIDLRQRFPGIHSRIEVNNWKYLVEHLRAEELDFFIADVRDVAPGADLLVQPVGSQEGGFYVRTGHPLLSLPGAAPTAILPYGLASVRLPQVIRSAVGRLLGLAADAPLPLAVECDDVSLLKQIALSTDTVLASTHQAVQPEVAVGRFGRLEMEGLPPLHSAMGIVSLKGRSHSPMAQFAVDYLVDLVAQSSS